MSKTYYHVSSTDLGQKVKLIAKIPETAGPDECKKTLRVCFAPSHWQCMMAIASCDNYTSVIYEFLCNKHSNNPTVYKTRAALKFPKNRHKSDFKATGEMWATRDITVTRLGYIDMQALIYTNKLVITQNPSHNFSNNERALIKSLCTSHSTWSKNKH